MLTAIMVLLVLIVLNAFFAASEIALISLNDNKIKVMAEAGDKKARLLHHLLSEPSRFLATIQIGITLAGFLASAFAAESFSGQLSEFLYAAGVPLSKEWLENISVIVITLILSYFTLVLGELVPKRLAMQKAEPISRIAAVPLNALSIVTSPFVKLLTLSTNLLVRLFGVDPHAKEEEITEEEIRMMVDVGKEKGTIQEAEKMMIDNIFDFDNKIVFDIMTHRTHVVGIPIHATLKEITALINAEQYTRFPVYEDHMDNIVGILHVKDLLRCMERSDEEVFDVMKLIRAPYLVPFSKKTDELFKDLQKNKVHMAVVIDEYGGTAGIVTIEDLLEEIVGSILDEHDEEERAVEKLDENTYLMEGTMSLDEVQEYLKIDLPTEEYDTLSGFIINQLGRIPGINDRPSIEFNGVVFKVEGANEKRIELVKVSRAEL
ncbi:hemolysin family protein [Paenibacillus alkalitolerans]|uniref:hemolysin family protein n=1 Tax=Paenibacillus alkalitolerans TaxID=2799335 RepID=UPI0018F696CB|nr:hemolysin family protein [Paenibacillus alkalitolerans]